MKKIGILSSGGDCPGINATIRGVGKSAIVEYGMEVYGIYGGFSGMLSKEYRQLSADDLSGILNEGGTILGTSREKRFKKMLASPDPAEQEKILESYRELGLDCLVCIGGNGTQKSAYRLSQLGVNIIGVPKTIDNDIWGTDITFGFDTATQIATEAIDRIHSTAGSHQRVMVVEVMGHKAGWIALHSGIAAGADVILLPEMEYDLGRIYECIEARFQKGRPYSIVVVGEGVKVPKDQNAGSYFSKQIQKATGIETRQTVLGYIQRGGAPSSYDRILSSRLGVKATAMIAGGEYGRMVAIHGGKISSTPLEEVAGKLKLVSPDNELIVLGKSMGICFGG